MSQTIAVIGDGAWATVCSLMLVENGHRARMWTPFADNAAAITERHVNEKYLPEAKLPPSLEATTDAAAVFAGASLVLHTTPTQFIRRAWAPLREHCPRGLAVCSVSKGIENSTLMRPTQVLADVLGGGHPLAALSGPSIAPEVLRRLPATVVAASEDESLGRHIQGLISRPYFRVYTNADLPGVELAGATKNVIAIAAGMLDGLRAGDNAKAALLTRGLVEITRLGLALGAKAETFAGLAGMGDLVTTCISPVGRNRSFGEAVGKGLGVQQAQAQINGVVEGIATTASVVELARRVNVDMPITAAIHEVLFNAASPAGAITALMARPLRAEN